jgi:hypothetical protein
VEVEICDANETITRGWMERLGLLISDDDEDENDGIARIFLDCGNEHEMPPPARNVVLERCGRRRSHAGEVGERTTTTTTRRIPSAILAVGPERGWTDDEADVFVDECGFKSATLGGSILRVDAAVVVGLGIVSAALDECHIMTGTTGGGNRTTRPREGWKRRRENERWNRHTEFARRRIVVSRTLRRANRGSVPIFVRTRCQIYFLATSSLFLLTGR